MAEFYINDLVIVSGFVTIGNDLNFAQTKNFPEGTNIQNKVGNIIKVVQAPSGHFFYNVRFLDGSYGFEIGNGVGGQSIQRHQPLQYAMQQNPEGPGSRPVRFADAPSPKPPQSTTYLPHKFEVGDLVNVNGLDTIKEKGTIAKIAGHDSFGNPLYEINFELQRIGKNVPEYFITLIFNKYQLELNRQIDEARRQKEINQRQAAPPSQPPDSPKKHHIFRLGDRVSVNGHIWITDSQLEFTTYQLVNQKIGTIIKASNHLDVRPLYDIQFDDKRVGSVVLESDIKHHEDHLPKKHHIFRLGDRVSVNGHIWITDSQLEFTNYQLVNQKIGTIIKASNHLDVIPLYDIQFDDKQVGSVVLESDIKPHEDHSQVAQQLSSSSGARVASPEQQSGQMGSGYQEKYLKYKKKYMDLKNKLN
jgi:hypothetical protein